MGTSLIRTSPTSEAHISPLESVAPPPPAPHVTWKSEQVPDLRRSLLRPDTDRDPPPRRRRLRGPSHRNDPPPLAERGGVGVSAASAKWAAAEEEGGAVDRSERQGFLWKGCQEATTSARTSVCSGWMGRSTPATDLTSLLVHAPTVTTHLAPWNTSPPLVFTKTPASPSFLTTPTTSALSLTTAPSLTASAWNMATALVAFSTPPPSSLTAVTHPSGTRRNAPPHLPPRLSTWPAPEFSTAASSEASPGGPMESCGAGVSTR
uniref:Uncharacterized protein n=1 Tax=Oryza punctata TaxID=4537 RepID=A0A0E0JHR9_ORYPU